MVKLIACFYFQSDEFDGDENSQNDLSNDDILNEVFIHSYYHFSLLLMASIFVVQQGSNSENVDLSDNSLQVVISDALSEKDRVKFTVLSKVRVIK